MLKLKIEYDFFPLRNMSMTEMIQIVEKLNEVIDMVKSVQEKMDTSIESTEETEQWEPVKNHPNYIIKCEYPHTIKKVKNGREVSTYQDKTKGNYFIVRLDGKRYYLHHLVAVQFCENPNNYTQVDHIDRDKSNNNKENLRWCSPMQNMNNKVTDEIVYEIPEHAIKVDVYKSHEFEDLWLFKEHLWRYNHVGYKKIPKHYDEKLGMICPVPYAVVADKNKKRVQIWLRELSSY